MNNESSINKLLLNAWSAEFALGVVDGDTSDQERTRDYLLQWTLPQAFYSSMYMARALLLARGTSTVTTSEVDLFRLVDNLIDSGFYDYNQVWRDSDGHNFLRVLSTIRNYQTCTSSLEALQQLHRNSIRQIDLLLGWHERKIAELIGLDEYAKIILTMPDHLKISPMAARWLAMIDSVTF